MRPTKLTQNLLDAFRAVLTDELAAIAFTEEELVWQANRRLPAEEQISYRTYQRYKSDILHEEEHGDELIPIDVDDEEDHNAEVVQQMYVCLKDALMKQKLALVRGIYEGLPNWRRYSWMLERKFPDFKLRLPEKQLPIIPTAPSPSAKQKGASMDHGPSTIVQKKPEPEEPPKPLTVEEKWGKRYSQPWKPSHMHSTINYRLEQLRALEEEMERDVAAGYINPYAHLGYRPDKERHDNGFYKVYGMGENILPLRVHMIRDCDSPKREDRQALWEEQERKRLNDLRAEQDPNYVPEPPPPPAPAYEPRLRGILGFSAG
ncbi:hypothetical protein BH09BAC1_BH09BAC1_25810 [soil metagenome]